MEVKVFTSDLKKKWARERDNSQLQKRHVRFHMFKFWVRLAIRIAGSATYETTTGTEKINVK